MEGTGSHRLPFFCKRAHNDDGPRGTNQYLSLRRNWAGKLFSPPVRVCSRHYQIKLSKFCGYVMYRLAAIECKSAMQRTLPPTSSRHYSSSNNKSYGGQHQQQQQQHHQQKDRQNGSLPPPPNAREAGFGKVILLLTPLAAVGGVITYSKYDNGFRKMVEKNVPGAESVIKVALQEEAPFQGITKNINESFDKVKSTFNSVSNSVNSVGDTVTGFFGSKKATEVKPADSIKKAEPKAQQIEAPKVKEAAPAAKSETKTAKIDAADPPPKPPAPKVVAALPQEVLELEKAIEVSAQIAIKEYNAAIAIIKTFNEDVRRVVDKAVEHGENSLWTTLKNRASARDTAVSSAERAAREAQENMERCEIALSKAATVKNQEKVEQVRDKIKKMVSHISKAKDELYRHKDTANVSDKYWRSVEQARNYFIDEIESIFPGINLSEKKMNLSTEDLDLFILHAYSHVVAYQKELQRLQTDGELRLKRAIDSLRGENSSEALRAQLEFHLEAEKRKLAVENQKKIFQIRADADKQLRMQLKKQTEAHTDHLKDVVAQRETDLTRNFKRELDDKLAAEKANYKLQLAAMLGKLRGMDAALAERAETERSANQAQALWAACQALWASVRTATPGVHYKDKLRPLKNEIHAIAKVAEGDELVIAVLKNMPKEAEERGVFPEDALRERFINVERIARRLAMVPENGTSLPIYFLSFLQSIFIMRPDNPITKEELDNKPFDFSKLDTYDILNRARYYVDRGDFLQALKYLNLLQGAPREVAGDWMKETRLMLETQQAANTLMAHAAASGLMYL